MEIDHVGIVVKSLEEGIAHWRSVFGYQQHTEIVTNTRQMVKVVFLTKPNSLSVKLLEPSCEQSSIYQFAKRGGGLHHLCFKCPDVTDAVQRLAAMGLRILADPQPGEAFEGENIAFVYAKHGLNVELIDTDKRAGIISPSEEKF